MLKAGPFAHVVVREGVEAAGKRCALTNIDSSLMQVGMFPRTAFFAAA
jgi:hypothetical protein